MPSAALAGFSRSPGDPGTCRRPIPFLGLERDAHAHRCCFRESRPRLRLAVALDAPAAPPAATSADPAPITLFNGKNLDGWSIHIRHADKSDPKADPKGVFKVEDGVIHVSGEEFGCLTTDKEYRRLQGLARIQVGREAVAASGEGRPRLGRPGARRRARQGLAAEHRVPDPGARLRRFLSCRAARRSASTARSRSATRRNPKTPRSPTESGTRSRSSATAAPSRTSSTARSSTRVPTPASSTRQDPASVGRGRGLLPERRFDSAQMTPARVPQAAWMSLPPE